MQNIRTSISHPIFVNFIQHQWASTGAKLGISLAPGKCQSIWKRNLQEDLKVLKKQYNINTIVSLLQHQEAENMKIGHQLREAEKIGMKTYHFPVENLSAPSQEGTFKQGVSQVVQQHLKKGRNVMVHCSMGMGRAPTFAAACLIYDGLKPEEAIKMVQEIRKSSLTSGNQQQFLKRLKF